MSSLQDALGFFLPGVVIIAGLAGLGWLMRRASQGKPWAQRVRALGWIPHEAGHIEGPVPDVAGAVFHARGWAGEPWSEAASRGLHSDSGDGMSYLEFRVESRSPDGLAGNPQLRWPTERDAPSWKALAERHLGVALQDAQVSFEASAWMLRLVVNGSPGPRDTEALIAWAKACLANVAGAPPSAR